MQSSLLHMSYLVFKITDILNVVKPFWWKLYFNINIHHVFCNFL
jgi:hypothetical protein